MCILWSNGYGARKRHHLRHYYTVSDVQEKFAVSEHHREYGKLDFVVVLSQTELGASDKAHDGLLLASFPTNCHKTLKEKLGIYTYILILDFKD